MKMPEHIRTSEMWRWLIVLAVCSSAGLQGWRSIYNNFAVGTAGINGFQTGVIQSVRELPGFLALLIVYLLFVISEKKLSAIAVLLFGVGIFITGLFPTFWGLIFTTFIMSTGFHYFEATNQSLTLQSFSHKDAPLVFGKTRSVAAIANIVVGVFIWLSFTFLPQISLANYFYLFGIVTVILAIYSLIKIPKTTQTVPQIKKIVLKRKYSLYYLITFFSGARRQIFVVFAEFLLVAKYGFTVEIIAILFVINNLVSYFINPAIARGINKFGEKKMLGLESISMVVVFLGYAFINNKYAALGFYFLDYVFFQFAMAVNTYMQKTVDPADISSTVATGFTINHTSAVIVPVLGGVLWLIDPKWAFIAGVIFSLIAFSLTRFIKTYKVKNA